MFFDKSGLLEHSWYRVTKATLKLVSGVFDKKNFKVFYTDIYGKQEDHDGPISLT